MFMWCRIILGVDEVFEDGEFCAAAIVQEEYWRV